MSPSTASPTYAYIGSYADAATPGVYACSYDSQNGRFALIEQTCGLQNPTFLAINPPNLKLYAIADQLTSKGQRHGAAVTFNIDAATGKLSRLDEQTTVEAPTCHINLDHTRQYLFVASYHGGMIGLLPVDEDGAIGVTADVQQHIGSSIRPQQDRPHPHSVFLAPDNRFALVPDLGLDRIRIYRLDESNRKLIPHGEAVVEPGAGPRHFAFHPQQPYGYVINELNSTITAFSYDAARGQLTEIQTISTLPESFVGDNATADIHISPDGRFLYGSNRGHDSIAVFGIDPSTGMLTLVEHASTLGKHPRNFALSPDGRFLLAANRDTDNVVTFTRDAATGKLQPTGDVLHVSKPVCVKFLTQA